MSTSTSADATAVSNHVDTDKNTVFAGVQAAIDSEVERRVRRRFYGLITFAVIAGGIAALLVAGDAFAASDPVAKAGARLTTWGGTAFGVFCAWKAVHAIASDKIAKFAMFAVMALLAVPFVFSPDAIKTVGTNLGGVLFGI